MEAVRKRGGLPASIAIEKSHLTVERLERMDQLFAGATFVRLDEQLNGMRNIKSEDELTNYVKPLNWLIMRLKLAARKSLKEKLNLKFLWQLSLK